MVGDITHHGEIMRDEQHRHPVPFLQVGDQVEYLLLDGHIERRRRFVGDQELRLARDRHRDHHALLLAARQLEWIRIHLRPGVRNAYLPQEFDRAGTRLAARLVKMPCQDLGQLEADREHGIQRTHGLLKYHRDRLAPQLLQLAGCESEQVAAAVQYPAVRMDRRIFPRQQAQDRQRGHRLAAARFPDQRNRAVHRDVEIDAFDRFEDCRACRRENPPAGCGR